MRFPVPLLTVEDCFLIPGRGLLLAPDLPLPPEQRVTSFEDQVLVVRPDGSQGKYTARFELTHFLMAIPPDKTTMLLNLFEASRDDAPPASQVFGTEWAGALLTGGTTGYTDLPQTKEQNDSG
jgi:hypothetical protein